MRYIDKFIYKKNESYSQQWMWLKEQYQKEDVAWRVGREAGRKETGIKHMGKINFLQGFYSRPWQEFKRMRSQVKEEAYG